MTVWFLCWSPSIKGRPILCRRVVTREALYVKLFDGFARETFAGDAEPWLDALPTVVGATQSPPVLGRAPAAPSFASGRIRW